MNTKLLALMAVFSSSVFAISLGDVVTTNTMKAATTTQSVMKLTKTDANHKEYTITDANGVTKMLVNNQGVAYGFKWNEMSPNLKAMLGSKYQSKFDKAYANRPNKFNHRMLSIDTPDLSVHQAGLPDGPFQGEMYAKDLAPQ